MTLFVHVLSAAPYSCSLLGNKAVNHRGITAPWLTHAVQPSLSRLRSFSTGTLRAVGFTNGLQFHAL